MIKRIIIVAIIIILLFAISYNVHLYVLDQSISFSLLAVYLFHAISAILVYCVVEAVANYLPNQAGYAYLMMMFLKIGAFVLIFQTEVFVNDALSWADRVSLVVPLFLFLIAEALAVGKLLNKK